MNWAWRHLLLIATTLAAPASAEVKSAADNGFEIGGSFVTKATPVQVVEAVGQIGRWWDLAHTYSGKAENLSLDLRPGGCFCEALPGGGVEHARVAYIDRAGGTVRLRGAFGPMQGMGVDGAMTIVAKAGAGGTTVTMSYAVGGYFPGGAKALAPIVDRVMGGQLAGLQNYLEKSAR